MIDQGIFFCLKRVVSGGDYKIARELAVYLLNFYSQFCFEVFPVCTLHLGFWIGESFLLQISDDNQFLFETKVEANVQSTLDSLVQIHNLRQKIHKLKLEGEELAKYGPAKQPQKQGIDTYAEENVEKGEYYLMDPTGRRTGNGTVHLSENE